MALTGLNANMKLDRGKIVLSSDIDRHRDAIWFFCVFDKYRIYLSDFKSNLFSLLQRGHSYILRYRPILLGNLQTGVEKFTKGIKVNRIEFGTFEGQKDLVVAVDYTSEVVEDTDNTDVIFI